MRSGWAAVALGELVERVTAKNGGGVDRVFTVSAEHGLVPQEEFFTKRVASQDLSGYVVVAPGDYVYSKSYSKRAPLGAIARNTGDEVGVVSPIYIVFRPTSAAIDPKFLGLATQSRTFESSLRGMIKEGGRAHGGINISVSEYFSAKILLPPIAEQRRIVAPSS